MKNFCPDFVFHLFIYTEGGQSVCRKVKRVRQECLLNCLTPIRKK